MAVVIKSRSKDVDIFAPFNAELLSAFVKQGDDKGLLTPWRKGNLARALATAAPTNKDEDFKYVNFRLLDFSELKPEHLRVFGNDNGIPATIQTISEKSPAEMPERLAAIGDFAADEGTAYLGSFLAAASEKPEDLATYLDFFNEKFPRRKFAHLAQAFLSQGVYFHVDRNSVIHKPRQLFARQQDRGVMTSVAGLVVLEENSRAEFFWDAESAVEAQGFHNGVLDMVVKSGSKLSVLVNLVQSASVNCVMTVRAYLGKDAELELVSLNTGGRLNQMEIDLQFAGEGSRATVTGVYLGRDKENLNLLTHQDHRVGHCKSDLFYVGTLSGTSSSNYLGKITIAPKAQRSDAYQKNRNLVLNKGVSVNSSPKLEIGANDVRCTHGATTSRVSDLEMFYLRSRGIDKQTAKLLLADGFLRQVSERIQSETIRQAFDRRLEAQLQDWNGK